MTEKESLFERYRAEEHERQEKRCKRIRGLQLAALVFAMIAAAGAIAQIAGWLG